MRLRRLVLRLGSNVPSSLDNFDAGYDALSTGVAILDRSHMGRVVASGGDALDLINRFSTNETTGLADGDVVITVLTSQIGHVLELITVVRRSATESILMTGLDAEDMVVEWLDRYNFGEDCDFDVSTATSAQITISGPKATDLGINLPEPGRYTTAEIDGVEVHIVAISGPSLASYEVLIDEKSQASTVWDELLARGGVPTREDAFDVLRVEKGLSARSSEISNEANPLEAGLLPYVDFDKGCYMGQEIIARLHTYDKLQRRLVGLLSESGTALYADSSLKAGDREVGRITSAVTSRSLGRPIAMAYVRKAHTGPGTVLESVNGPVEVVELPFAAEVIPG
ncbi:MAG TPA: aminomethyl transferase family protein [Dehalococcoidia bacterium]|nr:aminomethyl transferase family protein [Dehalococcoidia bacterium]